MTNVDCARVATDAANAINNMENAVTKLLLPGRKTHLAQGRNVSVRIVGESRSKLRAKMPKSTHLTSCAISVHDNYQRFCAFLSLCGFTAISAAPSDRRALPGS